MTQVDGGHGAAYAGPPQQDAGTVPAPAPQGFDAPPPPPPPAPAPAPAPSTPPQLPLGLTPDDLGGAAHVLLRSFAPVLAALTVVGAVFTAFAVEDEFSGSLADWIRTAVLLTALAMGGRAAVEGTISAPEAAAEIDFGLRILPLAVTLAILVLVARSSARQERSQPSTTPRHLIGRAAVTGLFAGAGMGLLTALSSTSSAYGLDVADEFELLRGGVDLGAGPIGTALWTAVLVGVTALVARSATAPSGSLPMPSWLPALRAPERASELGSVLRVLRTFAVGLLAATAVALVLAVLHRAVLTDDLDGTRLPAFVALIVLGINAVIVLLLAGLGVPLTVDGESSGSYELLEFLDDSAFTAVNRSIGLSAKPVLFLVLLVPVVVALLAAVRRTLRDHTAPAGPRELKQAAGVGAAVALLAAFVVQVTVSGSVTGAVESLGSLGGSADFGVGPSLLWAPLLGAAWATFAVWALRLGPTLALSLPPRLVRLVAGKGIRQDWSAALTGTGPAPAGRASRGIRLGARLLVLAAALAALATAVVALLNALLFTPQATAEEYFDALADANVAAVAEQMADAPDLAGQPLLESAVLDSEDFVAISDVGIGTVDERDGYASVEVSYSVDGERYTDSVSLRTGEDRFGFLRTWEVDESLPVVDIWSESGLGHQIGGEQLAVNTYLALPGGYTFSPADHAMLTAADAEVVVTTDAPASALLTPQVKPEAMDAAREAVHQRIAECLASTEVPLDNCPFLTADYWYDDLSDVSIEIVDEASWSLEYDESLTGFRIESSGEGTVLLRGTETVSAFFSDDEDTTEPYEQEWGYYVDGEVTGVGRQLEVSFPY